MIVKQVRLLVAALAILVGVSAAKAGPEYTADDYYLAGQQAKRDGDINKAQVLYAAALLKDINHYGANVEMAWVYNEKKDYTKAKLFALGAIGVNKNLAGGWKELGYALWKLGELDDAEKSLKIVLIINPDDAAAKNYLKSVRVAKAILDD